MREPNRGAIAALVLILCIPNLLLSVNAPQQLFQSMDKGSSGSSPYALSANASSLTPLRRIAYVADDPFSYRDEFSYMAAVPSSVFHSGGTTYMSPLILSENSQSEIWLSEDWADYVSIDGGMTQTMIIGDLAPDIAREIKQRTGTSIFPWIRGSSSAQIAAEIAVADWQSSDIGVFALAKDSFESTALLGNSTEYVFTNQPVTTYTPDVTIPSTDPVDVVFTPPSDCGWIEASINWTGSAYFTHVLKDPSGRVVDYSVWTQTYWERFSPQLDAPVPLQFWIPKTMDGQWTLRLYPWTTINNPLSLDFILKYHPSFTYELAVGADVSSLHIDLGWDKTAADLNLALVDPTGRLVAWDPSGSILARPGSASVDIEYPMAGTWTVVVAWMDATVENNNVNLSWQMKASPSLLEAYLESAANGAVLASLLNAPLLYVDRDAVPEITDWAASRLGISVAFLVDPQGIHTSQLYDALDNNFFVNNLNNYQLVTQWIKSLSASNDVVVTVPRGDGSEFFAPAALSAAYRGGPVFSLCDGDNSMMTRAEETWAPYLIGPEIDVYVTNRYSTRTENGWYDERIPNKYSMQLSVNSFEAFLVDRAAYNSSSPQDVVVVSPTDVVKTSFDRSLQSHFSPGRIPAPNPAMASVMINRGMLHRFLFETSESADTSLVSMYAYTHGASLLDNNYNLNTIYQYENSTSMLEDRGFTIDSHIGYNEVYEAVNSQLALWTFSTHGTLTRYPTDPPNRPEGEGLFSLRDEDIPYGVETESQRDANGDQLVNPVMFASEQGHHRIETTSDLEGRVGHIGSPIVLLTACLLGGSRLPSVLMERGSVAVFGSPRTVYFQPAAMLSLYVTESLVAGRPVGRSLSEALTLVSSDYSDPLPTGEPRDYANQHILFGDPSVVLYHPSDSPHIVAVDPYGLSLDGHTPGRGTRPIVGLGGSDYLPTLFDSLLLDHDYYEVSNYSDFLRLLFLRRCVLVEPDTTSEFSSEFASSRNDILNYVTGGGTLVVLGVSGDLSWLPWPLTYVSSASSSGIDFLDDAHSLVSVPNELSATVDYQGHFAGQWANFSIIATDGANPVIVASTVGVGKIALSTTRPAGLQANLTVENAVSWFEQPSLILDEISTNQEIAWEGDRIVITLRISDAVGQALEGIDIEAYMNETDVTHMLSETGDGIYVLTLTEEWTSGRVGYHNLGLNGRKSGYDSMTITLVSFIYIRPSPVLILAVGGGLVAVAVIAYTYYKRRRGKSAPPPRVSPSPSLSRKERARREEIERQKREEQKKRDKEFDPKEFFEIE